MNKVNISKEQASEYHNALSRYFKEKIINGEYDVISRADYTWVVRIDDSYDFSLWICNEDYGFRVYNGFRKNCMELDFNSSERKKAWNKIKKQIQHYRDNDVKAEKLRQFEVLKKELGK